MSKLRNEVIKMDDIPQFLKNYGPTFGVLGALIIYGMGRIGAYRDRKRNYRSFIKTEFIEASYMLSNLSLKENTKLVITNDYEQIMAFLKGLNYQADESFLKNTYLGYMQIKNIGPGLILSASVEMHMSSDTQSWSTQVDLPILEVGETVYVPTDKQEAFDEVYHVDKLVIKYKTQQNENIKYVLRSIQKEADLKSEEVTESFDLKLPFVNLYKTLHKSRTGKLNWLYLNNKK